MGARVPNTPPAAPLPRSGPVGREQEAAALQAQARAVAAQLQANQARIDQVGRGDTGRAMAAVVDPERCVGCGACEKVCPAAAISVGALAKIDRAKCTACGRCVPVCPQGAIALQEDSLH